MTFKKGQSGNPNGRPRKNKPITDLLRRLLAEKDEAGVTRKERIVRKMLAMAEEGQLDAAKYICDRLEGRPPQAVELTGDKGAPVRITYVDGNKEA